MRPSAFETEPLPFFQTYAWRGGEMRMYGVGAGVVENERMRDGAACEERAMARVCGVGR